MYRTVRRQLKLAQTDLNARRSIPLTVRVSSILNIRLSMIGTDWIFPSKAKSGHIEQSTLKKQHGKACKIAGIQHFPFYTFRNSYGKGGTIMGTV